MHLYDFYLGAGFIGLLATSSPLLGAYMHFSFNRSIGPAEARLYRISQLSTAPMSWKQYLKALLSIQLMSLIFMMAIFLLNSKAPISLDLAFNLATSFITNTAWQNIPGESHLSHFSQMIAITTQNFMAPAVGTAALLALTRGIFQTDSETIGNFWVDFFRMIVFILLPLSLLLALFLVSQGSIQNLASTLEISTLEGAKQILPMGPAASQTAIAALGGNGAGFFSQNLAHPFANPTGLTNWVLAFSVMLIPASLAHYYGIQIGSKKVGWVLFSVMLCFFIAFFAISFLGTQQLNSLEGQEIRFGNLGSLLIAHAATATANGTMNIAPESLSPLSSAVMMFQMMLGEIIFGGSGTGLYGLLLFSMLTVFIAGLMIGRDPEYLGKKIQSAELKWILFALMLPSCVTLLGSAYTCWVGSTDKTLFEILYNFASNVGTNGSALSGFKFDSSSDNIMFGVAMWVGRLSTLIPVLILAGILSSKKRIESIFEVSTPLFGLLLTFVILMINGLTFLPSLLLGPLNEYASLLEKLS